VKVEFKQKDGIVKDGKICCGDDNDELVFIVDGKKTALFSPEFTIISLKSS
jgi:hypothetical protein